MKEKQPHASLTYLHLNCQNSYFKSSSVCCGFKIKQGGGGGALLGSGGGGRGGPSALAQSGSGCWGSLAMLVHEAVRAWVQPLPFATLHRALVGAETQICHFCLSGADGKAPPVSRETAHPIVAKMEICPVLTVQWEGDSTALLVHSPQSLITSAWKFFSLAYHQLS